MVNRYLAAHEQQESALRGGAMEVDIDASVPNLQKQGKLHALRNISRLGKITYHALGFSGDNTVKNEVIARFLKLEVEDQATGSDISITRQNYKFKYKGAATFNGRDIYILHLSPRQKKVGLFKGEIWLDAATCMPVRESGEFVKTPSIFLKKMQFVREYDIQDGLAVPQKLVSLNEVRFFGKVQMNVNFGKFAKDPDEDSASASPSSTQ